MDSWVKTRNSLADMLDIRRLSFLALAVALFAGCQNKYSKMKLRPISAVTATSQQKALLKSLDSLAKKPDAQLGLLLDAANIARLDIAARPTDALAKSNYNFAVGRIVGLIEKHSLEPWARPLVTPAADGGVWAFTLAFPKNRPNTPQYRPSDLRILPADRYKFEGKLVGTRMKKQGVGAPVVVEGKNLDFSQIDEFVQGEHLFYGMTAILRFEGRRCELSYIDPLENERVQLDGNSFLLAADFQAPLALGLAETTPKKDELAGLFSPDARLDTIQLSRLQPYSPDKIPVLCIHGLGNSQATWMPMIDFLRNDPVIREHYQFWFFAYPSGLAYPAATSILRDKLDQFQKRYPDHKDIVLIGHSMGGMISRLLITDSGMEIWNSAFAQQPDELPVSEATRQSLQRLLIFKARDDVSRVIFASASHRDSDHATNFFGRLGAKIVGEAVVNPKQASEAEKHIRPEIRAKSGRLPNSVDVLDPDSHFLEVVNNLPTKAGIPFHSIIGDRGKGGNLDRTKPQSTDGIVPYWSSHLEGAESELVIPSEHWSILHPLGMSEIKRILIEHLQ